MVVSVENRDHLKGLMVRHVHTNLIGRVVETRCLNDNGSPAVVVEIKKEGLTIPSYAVWALDEIESA